MLAMIDLSKPWPLGFNRSNWPVFALGFVAAMLVLLWLDHSVSVLAIGLPNTIRAFFADITRWGESDWILIPSLGLLVLTAVVALLIPKRIPRLALLQMVHMYALIFVGVGLPGLIANFLKRLIGRSRPDMFDTVGTLGFHSFANNYLFEGFPSGHTTTAVGFACIIGFLAPRWFAVGLVYAIAIAFSRLSTGMHYPTDILGGAVLGGFGAYAVRYFFAKRRWGFEFLPDGRIVPRPLVAVKRLASRRPKANLITHPGQS
ncbi:MAG TPA: phosphatase PAP2 family protein [Arsenicitalea sp.]|jgi:undecaprenyl-diphosphatase|nr:phosphatase PAP2 family protein [Arsenicitalea sp.]